MIPTNPGRVQFFDPNNLNYLIKDEPPARAVGFLRQIARAMGIRDTRRWRQWMYFPQGDTPRCTAFGTATFLAADPVRPTQTWLRLLDVGQLYKDIQSQDRKEGRVYAEGATTLAAMKVGQARGWWPEYRWSYSIDQLCATVHDSRPVIVGTNYYESQFYRDQEGIARIRPGSPLAGGHYYVLNGYDPRRGLLRSPQTWDDGDYWYPVEDLRRLVEGEDGEGVLPMEVRPL